MKTHLLFKKYYLKKSKTSPAFTIRSLARRLDVSPSFLSRVLNGKRTLPAALQKRLAEELGVDPETLATGKKKRVTEATPAIDDWAIATNDAQQILRAWHFIPILELTDATGFDGSAAQISARLGLTPYATEMALAELERIGLIEAVDGRYRKTDKKLRITASRPNPLIRKFHDEMMERSQLLLRQPTNEEDLQRRLISGITVTASPARVQEAKRKLNDCLYQIANDLLSAPGEEVYHLAVQLFPLTK